MAYVILKVDTTGLDPNVDDIIRISALKVDGVKSEFSSLVNPGGDRKLSDIVKNITGLSDVDLEGAPTFAEIKDSLLAFIGEFPIIGHNIKFDLSFINKYLDSGLKNKSMSLMDMAVAFGYRGSLKFVDLCSHYNIAGDSIVDKTDKLFIAMMADFNKKKDDKTV